MPSVTLQEQLDVRRAMRDYLKRKGYTSLRLIRKWVTDTTGRNPSVSTIARILQEPEFQRLLAEQK